MNSNILNTIILAIIFLTLFASAELLYHKLKIQAEYTRKYVHISTGFLTMLFPPLIQNHWLVLALCGSFLLVLVASLYFKLLPSINAVNRTTRGSLLYPIIVYGCYLVFDCYHQKIFYYIPILILAICDPIAALTGKKWPLGKYKIMQQTKTMMGSAMFLISAIFTCFIIMKINNIPNEKILPLALIISVGTCIAEALSINGYDNFTIPGTALGILILMYS